MDASNNFLIVDNDHYMREVSELLTLVIKSYETLDIGQINHINELKFAIEHVELVKKQALEMKNPDDVESLGLAASFFSHEDVDTFERVVAFFYKKKPVHDVPWQSFTVKNSCVLINDEVTESDKD